MSIFFITWDIIFTQNKVWGFNPDYVLGVYLFKLPIEEYLFFIVIPYACLFIYETTNYLIKKDIFNTTYKIIFTVLALSFIITSIFFYNKLYTSICFVSCGVYILFLVFYYKVSYLSKFLLSYLVSLIPFFLINGILTGSFIEEEIIWYNPQHIFNIRIFTIPIEDTVYSFFMLLMTVSLYEHFKVKLTGEIGT